MMCKEVQWTAKTRAKLPRSPPRRPPPYSPRLLRSPPPAPVTNPPEYAAPDVALQQTSLPPAVATLCLNIAPLGHRQSGVNLDFSPPDTNGAVGATQYV